MRLVAVQNGVNAAIGAFNGLIGQVLTALPLASESAPAKRQERKNETSQMLNV